MRLANHFFLYRIAGQQRFKALFKNKLLVVIKTFDFFIANCIQYADRESDKKITF